MWIWWGISMVIVVGCIVYAMYLLISSRKLQKVISSATPPKNPGKNMLSMAKDYMSQQSSFTPNPGQQFTNENPAIYLNQISNLQQRLQVLENEVSHTKNGVKTKEDATDWEQLYNGANSAKQKLEDDLYYANESLQAAEAKLAQVLQDQRNAVELESALEARLSEIQSLQNRIGELQQKLEGANNREQELEEQVAEGKTLVNEYRMLQQQHSHLLSETDELRNRLQELSSRNSLLQQKVNHLTELESSLESFEYEKTEIKHTVEEIISENTTLSQKLQELQEKLASEKYAG
jgi:chromosome segregation ATPase